ncbi:hypothetical protein Tco_0789481 [Tanacetum coccineum]
MKFFPLSLADDARQWWIDEGDGKITTWKELVEKKFCKFYPLSCDGDDEILEEEEFDYGNPPNTTTDSSFKPCLNDQEKDDIEKKDERSQKKRKGNNNTLNKAPKSNNQNNEQHSKRVCKAEKFEAIKYSLGPNEEYIAISTMSGKETKIDLAGKEIDKVGEVSIIWNPMCVL